jgi:hypothetical protein
LLALLRSPAGVSLCCLFLCAAPAFRQGSGLPAGVCSVGPCSPLPRFCIVALLMAGKAVLLFGLRCSGGWLGFAPVSSPAVLSRRGRGSAGRRPRLLLWPGLRCALLSGWLWLPLSGSGGPVSLPLLRPVFRLPPPPLLRRVRCRLLGPLRFWLSGPPALRPVPLPWLPVGLRGLRPSLRLWRPAWLPRPPWLPVLPAGWPGLPVLRCRLLLVLPACGLPLLSSWFSPLSALSLSVSIILLFVHLFKCFPFFLGALRVFFCRCSSVRSSPNPVEEKSITQPIRQPL